jgi:hypothetical protein
MIKVTIAKLKPEEEPRLRSWMAELTRRREEVLATFAQEGVRHEQAYVLRTQDGPMLIYVMEAENHDRARKAFQSSTLAIDQEHQDVMSRVLEGRADAELVYECKADDQVR